MANNKKLLIVNDDFESSGKDLLITSLARRGVDAVVVGSVKNALKVLKNNNFDLVITDIKLTGSETGIDLLKEIRKIDKKTKVFICTGFGNQYEKEAKEAGADFYFEKPIDLQKHILTPLGVGKIEKERQSLPLKNKELSLKDASHELHNNLNCVIMVSSLLKVSFTDFLENKELSKEIKTMLKEAISDLGDVEQNGKKADKVFEGIKKSFYRASESIQPDNIVVKVE